ARAVARRRGLLPRRELALYLVHGCLHLAGFDDLEPRARRRMRAAERAVLAPLGFAHAARRTRRRTARAFPARVTRAATTPSAARRARTKSGISRGKARTRARG
ncbi:MAG: rRNA maturation RNAse YbeY, partial [Planctomycetota bacterium]